MVLRDTLVYDSESWSAHQPFQWYLYFCVWGFYMSCHVRIPIEATTTINFISVYTTVVEMIETCFM